MPSSLILIAAAALAVANAAPASLQSTQGTLARRSNTFSMNSFTQTSCGGIKGDITNFPDGTTCLPLSGIFSVSLNDQSGCATTFFGGDNCSGAAFQMVAGQCDGFNTGGEVKSIKVTC